MNRYQRYIIEGIIAAFGLLFLFWSIGYWGNGLYGAKFDLQSCWNGVAALGTAGILAVVKYVVDSLANSEKAKMPYMEETNDNRQHTDKLP